jgi:hypothetical protein
MGVKHPTSGGTIATTGTKTGLNKVVDYIGGVYDVYFNDTPYPVAPSEMPTETILHVFGLVDRYVDENNKAVPLAYSISGGTLTDQISLLPSDRYPGFLFFDYDEPVTFSPSKFKRSTVAWEIVMAKLNMIFFFNMKRQKYYVKWGSDYRVQKETLRERVIDTLLRHTPKRGCELNLNNVYDKSIQSVFKGYDVSDSRLMADLYPYYAIRLETAIKYREGCV